MKNRTLFIIGIVLMALSSCNNKSKNVPCQIIVYDQATFTKSYLINYNGKDSIETTCGALSFDITDKLVYNQEINMKEVRFRRIYLRKSQKITKKQNDSVQTIICQLLSNPTTDTIPLLVKDATYIYMGLKNQYINLPRGHIKDKNIINISEKLIEYSPLYINTYSWFWLGPEIEEQMIQEYKQYLREFSVMD
jgi:hypothetical protein